MFHIDAQFEDTRIVAHSEDGALYETVISDNLTGKSRTVQLSAEQLSYVMQFNLHPDGEPEGMDAMYEVLNPIFEGWPLELRPIP